MNIFFIFAYENSDVATAIADELEHAGHVVWREVPGITGGKNWIKEIEAGIDAADWVVVLLSSFVVSNVWIEREIVFALELDKPVLPVLIELVKPLPVLEHLNYLDISQDRTNATALIVEMINILSLSSEQIRIYSRSKSSDEREKVLKLLRSLKPPKTIGEIDKAAPSVIEIARVRERIARVPTSDRVFIAYSHCQRHLVKELSELFVKNGKAVFYDAKIKAGATWRQTIQKALDDSTHVVVIWTPDAAASDEVEREVSYALAEHKVIVPVLSKEIPKLPYHLHGLHYIVLDDDLTKIEGDLLKAIEQFSAEDDIWQ